MNPSPSAQNPITKPQKKANPSSHFTSSGPSCSIGNQSNTVFQSPKAYFRIVHKGMKVWRLNILFPNIRYFLTLSLLDWFWHGDTTDRTMGGSIYWWGLDIFPFAIVVNLYCFSYITSWFVSNSTKKASLRITFKYKAQSSDVRVIRAKEENYVSRNL